MVEEFDAKCITKDLQTEARALGIPSGAAESFVVMTVAAAQEKLASKKMITQKDLIRVITKELKKYNADLAYVYENRDKIV